MVTQKWPKKVIYNYTLLDKCIVSELLRTVKFKRFKISKNTYFAVDFVTVYFNVVVFCSYFLKQNQLNPISKLFIVFQKTANMSFLKRLFLLSQLLVSEIENAKKKSLIYID